MSVKFDANGWRKPCISDFFQLKEQFVSNCSGMKTDYNYADKKKINFHLWNSITSESFVFVYGFIFLKTVTVFVYTLGTQETCD